MSLESKKIKDFTLSLTFDDVLLKPRFSSVLPKDIDLSLQLNKNLSLSIPVFSAAMDTVTEYDMAKAMLVSGGCGVFHKNMSIDKRIKAINNLKNEFGSDKPYAVAIGVSTTHQELESLVEAGANVMIVDSAHGHSQNVGNMVEYISKNFSNVFVIAGNVVTAEGAQYLIDKGAHGVKVGVGPGSICITRKVTGVGMGQLTAIMDVAAVCQKHKVLLIADGGIKSQDEIMKALAAGADAVMLGYMLAGTNECPGKTIIIENEEYKLYRGMGCLSAMKLGSFERYNQDGSNQNKWVAEGIESYIKTKGSVSSILFQIAWGLKSAFGYLGSKNLSEIHENAEFVRITNSVLKKSDSHSIDKVIKTKRK